MIERHLKPFCEGIGFRPAFLKSSYSHNIHVLLESTYGFDSIEIRVEDIEDQQWGKIVDLLSKFWDIHKKKMNFDG